MVHQKQRNTSVSPSVIDRNNSDMSLHARDTVVSIDAGKHADDEQEQSFAANRKSFQASGADTDSLLKPPLHRRDSDPVNKYKRRPPFEWLQRWLRSLNMRPGEELGGSDMGHRPPSNWVITLAQNTGRSYDLEDRHRRCLRYSVYVTLPSTIKLQPPRRSVVVSNIVSLRLPSKMWISPQRAISLWILVASFNLVAGDAVDPCKRQVYKARCQDPRTGQVKPSRFVLRYYRRGNQCVSYPYGLCENDPDLPDLFEIRKDCQQACFGRSVQVPVATTTKPRPSPSSSKLSSSTPPSSVVITRTSAGSTVDDFSTTVEAARNITASKPVTSSLVDTTTKMPLPESSLVQDLVKTQKSSKSSYLIHMQL
ncbi:unnamed protein product [Soboliphyme baturini]|uniref:BPTI/Kunitz inhibitor domain-containing protein n=1 Tax=Soboliphyme baturini TaxID=241478 RepID=A0A183ISL0_9BILA|nr:unnamed protein product [Soboliphyme baturini]